MTKNYFVKWGLMFADFENYSYLYKRETEIAVR